MTQDAPREGAEHGHVDHANLDFAFFAHVIGDRFSGAHQAALPKNEIVRIFALEGGNAAVWASGQFGVLGHALVGNFSDMIEEIGSL
jgi:hypothetical protein